MSVLIRNASLLKGPDLIFIERGFIQISDRGIITRVGTDQELGCMERESTSILDAEGLLLLPGLINAHTHIGDSIAKDFTSDPDLSSTVDPIIGVKRKILSRTDPSHLEVFMRNAVISMLKNGIVAFADFREGGLDGVKLLRRAVSGLKIKPLALGRIEKYFESPYLHSNSGTDNKGSSVDFSVVPQEVFDVLDVSDGLGISGTNENTDRSLAEYSKAVTNYDSRTSLGTKRLLAIHTAESQETAALSIKKSGLTEVERAIKFLQPDFVVHMTQATAKDIAAIATNKIGIVVCPRSNGLLGCGVPRIADMINNGCVVGLGTDNVMLNSPDLFKEMDYIWKVSRATGVHQISARDILKMATVNGAEILHLNSGCIEPGRSADVMFIDKSHVDLFPIHDPYASIVQRAGQSSIMGLMINGEFVTVDS
ncbi:MAG: amidohydrolase family protein [Nitrososphaeraceae archaeon]